MKQTVFLTFAALALCFGVYVRYAGCSVDGLPTFVQPHVRTALSTCTRGYAYVGAKLSAIPEAAQPQVSRTRAACARGSGYVGSKFDVLGCKLDRCYQWVASKISGFFPAAAVLQGASTPPQLAAKTRAVTVDAMVSGTGSVISVLPDDNVGGRHQRFIIRLASGQTLLVAHNVDLAPRITSLKVGDTVSYCGEYEPTPKGGMIHWTHRDPRGRHAAGWLKHNGHLYQ